MRLAIATMFYSPEAEARAVKRRHACAMFVPWCENAQRLQRVLPPNWLVEPLLLVTVRPAALHLLDEALAICRPTITYASKRLREAVEAVRGCRARGAGSEAR